MSKASPNNNSAIKMRQENQSHNTATNPTKKIPQSCYIKPKSTLSPVNIFPIHKTRIYSRSLILDGSLYQRYLKNFFKPLFIIQNLRFFNSICISNALHIRDKCLDDIRNFLRRLPSIKSLHLKFGDIFVWNTNTALSRIKTIISSVHRNIPCIKIHFSFSYGPREVLTSLAKLTTKYLFSPCRLKSLSITFEVETFHSTTLPLETQEVSQAPNALTSSLQRKFQRMTTVQNLQLLFLMPHTPILNAYTTIFGNFHNLQVLELVCPSLTYSKKLLTNLLYIQALHSLTLYYYVEAQSLIDLLQSAKAPRALTIRGGWIHQSKWNKTSQDNKIINTVSLHLDFKYKVQKGEKATFLNDFISLFSNLEELKICRVADEEESVINQWGDTIATLTNLRRLILGLVIVPLKGQINKLFSHLKNLYRLESLVLVIKALHVTEDAWRALEEFTLQNRLLQKFEIFWDNFNVSHLTSLQSIWEKMPRMDFIRLSYMVDQEDHGEIHEKVMSKLEKAIRSISSAREVEIATSCSYRTLINCEILGHRLAAKAMRNGNIDYFRFENESEIKTPFYNDSLFN